METETEKQEWATDQTDKMAVDDEFANIAKEAFIDKKETNLDIQSSLTRVGKS